MSFYDGIITWNNHSINWSFFYYFVLHTWAQKVAFFIPFLTISGEKWKIWRIPDFQADEIHDNTWINKICGTLNRFKDLKTRFWTETEPILSGDVITMPAKSYFSNHSQKSSFQWFKNDIFWKIRRRPNSSDPVWSSLFRFYTVYKRKIWQNSKICEVRWNISGFMF